MHANPSRDTLAVGIFLLLWIAAVVRSVSSVGGLVWPYDVDGLRDVAIAQAIGDGMWLSDPLYKGEVAWYSPLVPGAISLTAFLGDLPMPRAYIVAGLWLNSLIPLAFFGCARRLLGTWPALASTCAFLFLPGRPPAWASATYSPWLFPAVTAQVPFYAGIWAWVSTLDRATITRMVGVGLLLGVTFLAHTGPAVILAGIILLTAAAGPGRPSKAILVGLPCMVAFLVVSPFVLPIAARHGFEVRNRAPATWVYEPAHPSALLAGAARPSALINLAVVGIGIVWAHRRLERTAQTVLVSWAVIAASCFIYSLVAEQWPRLPTIVSAYHFFFSLRALKWLLFGCGFVAISNSVARLLIERGGTRIEPAIICASLVLLFAVSVYPRYLGREAFVMAPATSARLLGADDRNAYRWIRSHTDRSAVFLSSDEDALRVIGTAGRFVVTVSRFFSNPYVDYEARAAARDRMFDALLTGDRSSFEQLCQPFDVSYVLARGEQADAMRQRSAAFLKPAFTSESITIFEIARARRSRIEGRGASGRGSRRSVSRCCVNSQLPNPKSQIPKWSG